jgi:hypothetical protein
LLVDIVAERRSPQGSLVAADRPVVFNDMDK